MKKIFLLLFLTMTMSIVTACQSNENSSDTDVSDTIKEEDIIPSETESVITTYEPGMYKVGIDLPAGEYLLESTAPNTNTAYFEITNDTSGHIDALVANSTILSRYYVTLSDEQYLFLQNGIATPVDKAAAYVSDGTYPSGMYLVGKDIPAGEYKIYAEENSEVGAYVYVCSHISGIDSIIESHYFEKSYISQNIREGQYLILSQAYIKK